MNPLNIFLILLVVILVVVIIYLLTSYLPQEIAKNRQVLPASRTQVAVLMGQLDEANSKLDDKEKKINEYERKIEEFLEILKMRPSFDKATDSQNNQDVENFIRTILREYPKNVNQDNLMKYFNRQRTGIESYELIMKLQSYMDGVQRNLQTQNTTITPEQRKSNLALLLDMAMISFDCIMSFHSINAKEEQNLNIKVLNGTMTKAEAIANAKQITNIASETPVWLRVLKGTLEEYDIKDYDIIFSGYKL